MILTNKKGIRQIDITYISVYIHCTYTYMNTRESTQTTYCNFWSHIFGVSLWSYFFFDNWPCNNMKRNLIPTFTNRKSQSEMSVLWIRIWIYVLFVSYIYTIRYDKNITKTATRQIYKFKHGDAINHLIS